MVEQSAEYESSGDACDVIIGGLKTELDRSAKDLKATVEPLRWLAAIVYDSNDAILLFDLNGNIQAWNHGAEQIYRYSEADALDMNVLDIVLEADRDEFKDVMGKLARGGRIDSFETRRKTKDGRVLNVWLTITVLKDETGKPYAISTTERDITQIKETEEGLRGSNEELTVFNEEMSASEEQLRTSLEELQVSEERYGHLIETAEEGVLLLDTSANIILVNPKMGNMLGYPQKSLMANSVLMFVSDKSRDLLLQNLEANRRGEKRQYEIALKRWDDTDQWVIASTSPVIGQGGGYSGTLIMCTDISRRKRAEDVRSFLVSLVESSIEPIISVTPDGIITSWNSGAEKKYGYSKDEAIGRYITINVPHDKLDEMKTIIKRVISGESISNFETVRTDKAGNRMDMLLAVNPILSDGVIIGAAWASRDVSEIKRVEREREGLLKQLSTANRELWALTRVTAEAINTLDLQNLMRGLLKRIVETIGADTSTILLKRENLLHASASVGLENEVKSEFSVGVGHGFAGTIAATGKPLYIVDAQRDALIISPYVIKRGIRTMLGVPLKQGNEVIGVLHVDWTQVHPKIDSEIRLLEVLGERCSAMITNALLYKQTKELKEQAELYVDLMSHDINNMNQVARGFIEISIQNFNPGPDEKEYLENAVSSLTTVSRLIENVSKLKTQREGGLVNRSVDICEILKTVIASFSNIPDREVTIHFEPVPQCYITANDLVGDVFSNLIGNSIKHSDPDKPLKIDIKIEKTSEENRDYHKIIVEDNGTGIPDNMKARLFAKHERGMGKATGKGLGLYLVKTLVEDYNGKIWVEDRVPGDHTKGTKFVITLPTIKD